MMNQKTKSTLKKLKTGLKQIEKSKTDEEVKDKLKLFETLVKLENSSLQD